MVEFNVSVLCLGVFVAILQCVNVGSEDSGKIYFPGSSSTIKFDVKNAVKSDCLAGFCSSVDNYPQDHVEKLIDNNPLIKAYFDQVDEVPGIAQRGQFDSVDLEETLCEVSGSWMAPKIAPNINNETRLIAQKEPKEYMYMEVCKKNSTCRFKSSFPNNYEVYCKQKHMKRRLPVLKGNDTIYFDFFDIPCCCVCALKPIK